MTLAERLSLKGRVEPEHIAADRQAGGRYPDGDRVGDEEAGNLPPPVASVARVEGPEAVPGVIQCRPGEHRQGITCHRVSAEERSGTAVDKEVEEPDGDDCRDTLDDQEPDRCAYATLTRLAREGHQVVWPGHRTVAARSTPPDATAGTDTSITIRLIHDDVEFQDMLRLKNHGEGRSPLGVAP